MNVNSIVDDWIKQLGDNQDNVKLEQLQYLIDCLQEVSNKFNFNHDEILQFYFQLQQKSMMLQIKGTKIKEVIFKIQAFKSDQQEVAEQLKLKISMVNSEQLNPAEFMVTLNEQQKVLFKQIYHNKMTSNQITEKIDQYIFEITDSQVIEKVLAESSNVEEQEIKNLMEQLLAQISRQLKLQIHDMSEIYEVAQNIETYLLNQVYKRQQAESQYENENQNKKYFEYELKKYQDQIQDNLQSNEDQVDQITQLQNAISILEMEVQHLQGQFTIEQAENTQKQQDLINNNTLITQLKLENQDLEKQIDLLQLKIKDLTTSCRDLEDMESTQEMIKFNQRQSERAEFTLRQQLRQLQEIVINIQRENQLITVESQELKKTLNQYETEIAILQFENEGLKRKKIKKSTEEEEETPTRRPQRHSLLDSVVVNPKRSQRPKPSLFIRPENQNLTDFIQENVKIMEPQDPRKSFDQISQDSAKKNFFNPHESTFIRLPQEINIYEHDYCNLREQPNIMDIICQEKLIRDASKLRYFSDNIELFDEINEQTDTGFIFLSTFILILLDKDCQIINSWNYQQLELITLSKQASQQIQLNFKDPNSIKQMECYRRNQLINFLNENNIMQSKQIQIIYTNDYIFQVKKQQMRETSHFNLAQQPTPFYYGEVQFQQSSAQLPDTIIYSQLYRIVLSNFGIMVFNLPGDVLPLLFIPVVQASLMKNEEQQIIIISYLKGNDQYILKIEQKREFNKLFTKLDESIKQQSQQF